MLSDLKILDFTSLLPGPYATMMLGELGAKIMTIEAPHRVNIVKQMDPKLDDSSALYHTLHRNKTTIQLDLKNPDDLNQVLELVKEYDIILEGFRPGVMKRLGLDYDTLKSHNNNIIYCSLTGYGQDGPSAQRAGHDINYLALAGIPSYSGKKSTGPTLNGIQIADLAGGSLHVVIGILSAYIHRMKTGEGQQIDVAMLDTTFSLSLLETINYLASGMIPKPTETLLNGGSIYDYYRTLDDRFLSIGSLEPQFQQGLFDVLDIHPQGRDVHEIKSDIQAAIGVQTLDYWLKAFSQYDVCVEPVLTLDEVLNHPQVVHRNLIGDMEISYGLNLKYINHPIKYSKYNPKSEPVTHQ